jgi:hypothetical protein
MYTVAEVLGFCSTVARYKLWRRRLRGNQPEGKGVLGEGGTKGVEKESR